MRFTPAWRKAFLLLHVVSSLAWLGAIAAYLALALRCFFGTDDMTSRAAYIGMQAIGWDLVVPLGMASVATGVIQALGTPWGLFRYYWVIVKLGVSIPALGLLFMHMKPTDDLAQAAALKVLQLSDITISPGQRLQLVWDSAVALIVLLATTALSAYKPAGQMSWPRRERPASQVGRRGGWFKVLCISAGVALLAVIAIHLTGHSPHRH